MTWEPGRERVQQLIDAGEVDRVTPDLKIARRMLEDAARHLATASAAKQAGDLSGAYQLAYDALRKSAASLLEAQGLRATRTTAKAGRPRKTRRRARPVRHPGASAQPTRKGSPRRSATISQEQPRLHGAVPARLSAARGHRSGEALSGTGRG